MERVGGNDRRLMDIRLIDAIGPFFRNYGKRRINWSKIPFTHLRTDDGPETEAQWNAIAEDLARFLEGIRPHGFTAVTFDDLAHLVDHPWYEPEVRQRIRFFRERFRKLFALARGSGHGIFITSDYLCTTPAVEERLAGDPDEERRWYTALLVDFLDTFPEVDGVILRIGESDGIDVKETLRSRVALKRGSDIRRLLQTILPVFESSDRKLIFRTWSAGSYATGDLMWHPQRLARILDGIDSPALIVSMKPGDSDFFRHLPLNPLFHTLRQPKLIELQARREYEGAGEFPSFIGWECERLTRDLDGAANIAGFSIWCQTGGWHRFRKLAFLAGHSRWTELNVAVAARVMRGISVEDAIADVCGTEAPAMTRLLRHSEIPISRLLYITPLADAAVYFRRVRVPPLLYVFWDSIFVNEAMRAIVRELVPDHEAALREGEEAFALFDQMHPPARQLGWPEEDIRFMRDTFHLLLLARRYFFSNDTREPLAALKEAKKLYKRDWPASLRPRYRIKTTPMALPLRPLLLRAILRLLLRRGGRYRPLLDHVLTLRLLPLGYRFIESRHGRSLPKFVRKSAMGIGSLFR